MRIDGEWLLCDDGIVRPVIRGEILAGDGTWQRAEFLVDTGADRTVFSAAVLAALHAECAEETTLREETFASVSTSAGTSTTVTARSSASAPNAADSGNVCRETELTGDAATDAVTRAFDKLRERGR